MTTSSEVRLSEMNLESLFIGIVLCVTKHDEFNIKRQVRSEINI